MGARLGLTARSAADLQQLFPTRTAVRGSSSLIGSLFTIVSAYAWPTALQRGYEIAWGVSSRGWRGLWRPLVWLTAFVAAGAVLLVLPVSPLGEPWRTALLLLLGKPGGVRLELVDTALPAPGRGVLAPAAPRCGGDDRGPGGGAGHRRVLLSSAISSNYRHYGPLGIVFMLLTWLTVFSTIMLAGPVFGAALHERRRMNAEATTAERGSGPGGGGGAAEAGAASAEDGSAAGTPPGVPTPRGAEPAAASPVTSEVATAGPDTVELRPPD